jgi:hypothetical protein
MYWSGLLELFSEPIYEITSSITIKDSDSENQQSEGNLDPTLTLRFQVPKSENHRTPWLKL